jgi:hypothetical protein
VSILDGARDRRPFAGEGGQTGAAFEQAVLADGTPVIIKHVAADDWMAVVAGRSYLYEVWEAGLFDRVPPVIDHAMLEMHPADSGFTLVMRDVSSDVLTEGRVLTREENRRVLSAMDELSRTFWNEDVPGCPLADHFTIFSPRILDKLGHLDTPIPELMRRGWELFGDVAPSDVAGEMQALLADPGPLVHALDERPSTLIHGDLRLHNLGLRDDRMSEGHAERGGSGGPSAPGQVVLLDWELVGRGPPAVDFGWYLNISASRIDATREQIIDDYRELSGERFDPYALELAVIASLLFLGWNKAIDIVENPDPAIRVQERADLDWWIDRVRRALEVWSPL